MTLRQYWIGLPTYGKSLIAVSVTFGMFGLSLGLLGDSRGYWNAHPFGTNFWTSCTGALFGVPFAIVLIGWFTTNHGLSMERSSLNSLSLNSWSDFRSATLSHLSVMEDSDLQTEVDKIVQSSQAIIRILEAALDRNPGVWTSRIPPVIFDWGVGDDGHGYDEDRQTIILEAQSIGDAVSSITRAFAQVDSYADALNREWVAICGKWNFLCSYVRGSRHGAGLDWVPVDSEIALSYRIKGDLSPYHPVVAAAERSVLPFRAAILQSIDSGPEGLALCIRSNVDARIFDPIRFSNSATSCIRSVDEIRRAIVSINSSAWLDGWG